MVYTTEYASPLGAITLACDEEAIIGLWFNGQRYFGNILPKRTEQKERPLFADAKRWLDIYFSGREPDFLPLLRYDSTPFRKTVCEIMLTIPYGRTMTYGEIAAEVARRQGLEKMLLRSARSRWPVTKKQSLACGSTGSDILGISCRSEPSRKSGRCSQMRNAGWTYIFLDGSRISCRCCGMTPRRSAKRSARLC